MSAVISVFFKKSICFGDQALIRQVFYFCVGGCKPSAKMSFYFLVTDALRFGKYLEIELVTLYS